MFYYLNGTITLLDANLAVVDCGGVGYACHTTNYTLARLQLGKACKTFHLLQHQRRMPSDIFGFFTREELNCFERLLGVTGVGPEGGAGDLVRRLAGAADTGCYDAGRQNHHHGAGRGQKAGPAHHSGTQRINLAQASWN